MKNIKALSLIVLTLFSCTKEDSISYHKEKEIHTKSYPIKKSDYNIQLFFSENGEDYTFPNGLKVQKIDSIYVLGGDVIIPKKVADSLNNLTPQRSALNTLFNQLWHRGIVYYEIASNFDNPSRVSQAIYMFEQMTSLEFVPRTNQTDFIMFESSNDDRTYSEGIGKIGGKQIVHLAPWADYSDAAHEIGHAIGLYHEHVRQDRDDYVDILWNNIPSGILHNFQKYNIANGTDYGVFDYNSLMIYGSLAIINDNVVKIMTKKDGKLISPGSSLSVGDISGIKYLYGPPYAKCVTTIDSYEEYVGGGLDTYSSVLKNVIYFYSDKEMTQAITTTTPRLIKVMYENIITTNGGTQVSTLVDVMDIIIPSGVSSFTLPDSSYEYRAEYGYTVYEDKKSYLIVGAGF